MLYIMYNIAQRPPAGIQRHLSGDLEEAGLHMQHIRRSGAAAAAQTRRPGPSHYRGYGHVSLWKLNLLNNNVLRLFVEMAAVNANRIRLLNHASILPLCYRDFAAS